MNEPQTITADDLRALLGSTGAAPSLVLVDGVATVVEGAEDAGKGLEVITRDALLERTDQDPTDDALEQQASALTAAVQKQGG